MPNLKNKKSKSNSKSKHYMLDTSGLSCPYPLAKAKKFLQNLKSGDTLEVISTDPASLIDFKVFVEVSNNILLVKHSSHSHSKPNKYSFLLKKN